MKSEIPQPDGINLVLKMQLQAIADELKKPAKDITADTIRPLLEAARDTLEKVQKLNIEVTVDTMHLLPAPLRVHFLDQYLQYVFASFPK
jgi:hypothetical protein